MFNSLKKFASKKVVVTLTAALLTAGLIAGCGSSTGSDSQEKVIKVGAETTFPPFEFTEGDKYVGFDIDLADAVAKKMGYKMEFKSMGFDALIPALQSKDIDMIASGLSATPEREKAVLFSNPYFDKGGFVAIVKKGDTATSMNDLAGKRIVVQIGSVALDVAEKIPNAQIKSVDSNSQLFNELNAGTADAIVLDNAVALYYLKQGADADAKIIGDPVDPEPFVWAFRKDDKQLKEQADKALEELKADGTYDKIYEKWFGATKK
ncbi:basic amino acid ABC transporter substrate-binding protein [Veillonella sp.]|uniref:basic amino acid ABC transporter substrate-binding protein n=1 Tax=Veillonella sp. TaxID=1926307 RepID=UPI0025DD983E|nr:basic amino acid ABC transporter substrate-binding protein [Veillonella sp.]